MSLIRSSLLVGFGSVASRVLGFVRDVLFAQALGAGPVADAFLAAFRLPNLVRRVVGEGGLNPALVPALSRLEPDEAAATAGDVLGRLRDRAPRADGPRGDRGGPNRVSPRAGSSRRRRRWRWWRSTRASPFPSSCA